MDNEKYRDINKSFWEKIKSSAINAGKEVVEKAFILYYCLIDKDTPAWAKGTIIGALTYFISPVDAVPDVIPVIGYSDDLAVLAGAIVAVKTHIKREHREKAKKQVEKIFDANKDNHS